MPKFISSYFARFKVLTDKSAIVLIIPCLIALLFIDTAMLKTLAQWLIFAPIIAGVAVMVSRIVFPQVELTKLIEEVHLENRAAAIVVAGLMIFVGILIFSLVTWAKA